MKWIKYRILDFVINVVIKSTEVNKVMDKVRSILSGKKTYIVALLAILGVVKTWLDGGMADIDAIKAIIEAILAMTIRSGISKTNQ